MNKTTDQNHAKAVRIYVAVLAMAALAAGLSDSVLSNYFKDAYQVTAFQRGMIELPRELPGFIGIFIVSALSFLGDLRIAAIAQALMVIGLLLLGFLTPAYAVMLLFIFIHSVGGHLWYPLSDSIGLHLIKADERAGRVVGRFKGVSTAFSMLAAIIVFLGFQFDLFSFTTPIKTIFLVAGAIFLVVLVLLLMLERLLRAPRIAHPNLGEQVVGDGKPARRVRFVFRKEYKYYYALAIVFGVQKQIMMVFAPWVLIDLLGKKADTLALLGMAGAFIGIFFIPALGRWLDRFGIKRLLYVDAFSFILVYILYGLLSAGFSGGVLAKTGLPVALVFALYIIDRMSMQMGLIRSLYLRNIALRPEDIAPTMTMGQSMDHVVSIACATLGGLVWTVWGPQYVFFLAAFFSLINYGVARLAVVKEEPVTVEPALE